MSEIKVNKITPKTNCGTTQLGDRGDTVTVTGDLRSDSLKAADGGVIISQSGTNITIGASGDTISLASGASQSGFGRSGSVNWQTGSIKTANFTAASGEGYFCNTTGGAFTATLPSSPSAGDIVAVKDYAQNFATANLTIGRGGSNIEGQASDITLDGNAESITLVYVDATKGWVLTNESTTVYGQLFVTASGGSITTCGNYKIHTFTGPGTFCVSCAGNAGGSNTVDYLVVAGGGAGGSAGNHGGTVGGGGGAGGYRESSGAASGCYTRSPLGACVSALPVSVQGYPITVGAGGVSTFPGGPAGNEGSNSVFSTITSAGGGAGRDGCGNNGGSGGGGGANVSTGYSGGSGNTPPVSPAQGNDGGAGVSPKQGAGGGGATGGGVPGATPNPVRGKGGTGATSCITASPVTRAGGGGGSNTNSTPNAGPGGGGGAPSSTSGGAGSAGTVNTGGGGGGGPHSYPTAANGGSGGSGIVVIRYKFQ